MAVLSRGGSNYKSNWVSCYDCRHEFLRRDFYGAGDVNQNVGASKNSDFAQMQGAQKVSPRRICLICKQESFYATQQLG
jgi:hypothetical protein